MYFSKLVCIIIYALQFTITSPYCYCLNHSSICTNQTLVSSLSHTEGALRCSHWTHLLESDPNVIIPAAHTALVWLPSLFYRTFAFILCHHK